MSEKFSEVWECYDMVISSSYKGRGMSIIKTDKGLRALQQLATSEERLEQEALLKEQLVEAGYTNVDSYVRNTDGEFITCDKYHLPYVLKEYFDGRECNIRSEADMKLAIENLANLHLIMRKVTEHNQLNLDKYETKIGRTFERHNRELQRVRMYMRKKASRSEFDYLYLSCFDLFYKQAEDAYQALTHFQETSRDYPTYLCHGAYNQHNILLCKDQIATINFDHFTIDYQIIDLYTFLRKAMEKNDYNFELLTSLIDIYSKVIPFSENDKRLLYYLLWYPEKFWKISNQYNNTNKAWVPPKTFEKLEILIRQNDGKLRFLEEYRKYYNLNNLGI